jgi:hypothetical protein
MARAIEQQQQASQQQRAKSPRKPHNLSLLKKKKVWETFPPPRHTISPWYLSTEPHDRTQFHCLGM